MRRSKSSTCIYIIISVFLAALFLLPLVWMFLTSFKSIGESMASTKLLPQNWTMENYVTIFTDPQSPPIARWFVNTCIVAISGTILVMVVDVLAAYALARLDIPFKKFFVLVIVATLAIPGIISLFPSYDIWKNLGLLNTYVPLIFPGMAGTMGIFLIYNFLLGFPRDLEEAATVDGAGTLTILYKVVFPAIKPVCVTLSVVTFLGYYNDYLWPSLIAQDDTMKTMTVGIGSLVTGPMAANAGLIMAGTVIGVAPALIIFIFANHFFVEGVTMSGIK